VHCDWPRAIQAILMIFMTDDWWKRNQKNTNKTCDLIVMLDAHTQSVDEDGDENTSLENVTVYTSLHRCREPLPNICIVYISTVSSEAGITVRFLMSSDNILAIRFSCLKIIIWSLSLVFNRWAVTFGIDYICYTWYQPIGGLIKCNSLSTRVNVLSVPVIITTREW